MQMLDYWKQAAAKEASVRFDLPEKLMVEEPNGLRYVLENNQAWLVAEERMSPTILVSEPFAMSRKDWRCPCCERAKWETVQHNEESSLYCCNTIVHHHDHAGARFVRPRWPGEIDICNICNTLDAKAKAAVGAPSWWSFSWLEIRQFVSCVDGHPELDERLALLVWRDVRRQVEWMEDTPLRTRRAA